MIPPILGRFDLTPFSVNPKANKDGLVAEIGASVYFSRSRSFYSISSGGSDRLSIVDWSNLSDTLPILSPHLRISLASPQRLQSMELIQPGAL
jgi:hypothetical protein